MSFFYFIFHTWKIFDEQWQGPHEKSKKWTLFSFFLGSDFGPFGPKNTYFCQGKSKGPKSEVCKIRAKITFCKTDFFGLTFCGSPQKRQKSAQKRGIRQFRRFGPSWAQSGGSPRRSCLGGANFVKKWLIFLYLENLVFVEGSFFWVFKRTSFLKSFIFILIKRNTFY